jgi:hypothetical protein
MENLYYIETKRKCVSEVISKLKEHNLNTNVIESHYENHYMNDGDLIMWAESDTYPCFVHHAQKNTIKKCGIKINL